MNNFLQRTLTGIILVAVFIICIYLSQYSFFGIILLVNLLGMKEFYRLTEKYNPYNLHGYLAGILLIITSSLFIAGMTSWSVMLINIPFIFFILLTGLYSKQGNPTEGITFTIAPILFITLPCIFLLLNACYSSVSWKYQPAQITGFFLLVWSNDSCAYAIGKLFGRRPLFKRISPGKTWEGSVGGALGAFMMSVIVSSYLVHHDLVNWLILAGVVVVTGTYGDLIKSILKRNAGVKDSGNLLPGHGGILDRFDAAFGSAPFFFICLFLIS